MTGIRTENLYLAQDLMPLLRLVKVKEQESTVDGLVERIITEYLEAKYGLETLRQATVRIKSKRAQAEQAEADALTGNAIQK